MAETPPLGISRVTILVEYADGSQCAITTTGPAESIDLRPDFTPRPWSRGAVVFRINNPEADADGHIYTAIFTQPERH